MLDYSLEAERYDETRGGLPRARAAAEAVRGLIPEPGTVLDLACGTGLVTRELAARGRRVLGVDAASGMARLGAGARRAG
ncbi:class I SAM-dependent methyltransferase [[Actinomadura] parvosata]|uniref:class I SAM-dependent methyltransferase n=1 Tax=[Actinomadura] parvosata TaxID=1955412 RepID=UPI00406C0D4D